MKTKTKTVKIKLSEGEYNFIREFAESMRKENPKHANSISISGLIRFAVFHFYMAYLLGKIGDLKELKSEFLAKFRGHKKI